VPRLQREMATEISKMLRLPRKLQLILSKRRKSIAPAAQNCFRHVIKQVGMSRSAAPATQNDMTTCLKTFEKDMFCSFPHRHGAPQEIAICNLSPPVWPAIPTGNSFFLNFAKET